MRLHFLGAKVALTKTFTRQADGTLEKNSYPLIKNFTSHTEEANTTAEFYAALRQHAALGHCLLKGELDKSLQHEPRAGHTLATQNTSWLVFDLDGLKNLSTPEDFIQTLPKEFHDVSYVVQYSASWGIYGEGLRAHLFFRLGELVSPVTLKNWLTHLNFVTASLESEISLSRNGMTLSYPLDRTVAQNDKLIYIASPLCVGFEDPVADKRITLVVKQHDEVRYNFPFISDARLQSLTEDKVKALRVAAGLKPMKPKLVFVDSIAEWVLTNPSRAQVTDLKEQNGFIRLNINGGDSWAYYFHPENPKYLRNFKGEPTVLLKDFVPEFYKQWHNQLKDEQREKVLVFREPTTDTWWGGIYDPLLNRLERMHTIKSRDRIADFCANNNATVPDPIPDWTYEFCPQDDTVCSFERQFANRYEPTELVREARDTSDVPPTVNKVLWSVVGNDQESYTHFLNWLAYIYQFRQKTGTAWVLHGTPGTGKGLLFNSILRPIFGARHCITKELHNFDDKFNEFMETALLLNIDEARVDNARDAAKVVNQLKHAITEPIMSIRGMHKNPRQIPNYTNFIFTSNDYDSMRLDPNDRRFNVAPRQETPLKISKEEIEALPGELLAFAGFLKAYKVDQAQVRWVLNNAAKATMRQSSMDAVEQICDAVIKGDFGFFVGLHEHGPGQDISGISAFHNFDELIRRWRPYVNGQQPCPVRRKDLLMIYHYAIDPKIRPQKFNRLLEHKNLSSPPVWKVNGETVRAYQVQWSCDPDVLGIWDKASQKPSNVVPFVKAAP